MLIVQRAFSLLVQGMEGLILGSCLLCTIPVDAMKVTPLYFAFPVVGAFGYAVSVFFAYRLFQDMKKGV